MTTSVRTFDRLLRLEFDPTLVEEFGFSFSAGTYHRTLQSGVIQLVILDYNVRSKRSFRIILGLNAVFLYSGGPYGAYFAQYLTPGSITDNPASLRWRDEQTLRGLISKLGMSLRGAVPQWLDRYSTLASFADAMSAEYDYEKGLAYLKSGCKQDARRFLQRYRSRILQDSASSELEAALADVDQLLESVAD